MPNQDETANYCAQCMHSEIGVTRADQRAFFCKRFPDLVTGLPNEARMVRYDEKQCGRKGMAFEPKTIAE